MTTIGRIDRDLQEFKKSVLKRLDDIEQRLMGNGIDFGNMMKEISEEDDKKEPPKKTKISKKKATELNDEVSLDDEMEALVNKDDKDIVLKASNNGEIIAEN